MSRSSVSFLRCAMVGLALAASQSVHAQQPAPGRTPYGTLDRTDFDAPQETGKDRPALLGSSASPVQAVSAMPAAPATDAREDRAVPDSTIDGDAARQAGTAPVIEGAVHPPAAWVAAPANSAPEPIATPAAPAPVAADPAAARMRERARSLLATGAVEAARALLSDPALSHDGEALHMLSGTYDPATLARLGAVGVLPDQAAADRYARAASEAGWQPPTEARR